MHVQLVHRAVFRPHGLACPSMRAIKSEGVSPVDVLQDNPETFCAWLCLWGGCLEHQLGVCEACAVLRHITALQKRFWKVERLVRLARPAIHACQTLSGTFAHLEAEAGAGCRAQQGFHMPMQTHRQFGTQSLWDLSAVSCTTRLFSTLVADFGSHGELVQVQAAQHSGKLAARPPLGADSNLGP